MTREELIERTWKMYVNEIVNWETHKQSFHKAVKAALDAQARGCKSVYREESLKIHPGYYNGDMAYSIIKADPEVEG